MYPRTRLEEINKLEETKIIDIKNSDKELLENLRKEKNHGYYGQGKNEMGRRRRKHNKLVLQFEEITLVKR